MPGVAGSPQARAMTLMAQLFEQLECNAVSSHLNFLISEASAHVNDEYAKWASFDLSQHAGLVRSVGPDGRRKRADWHLKQYVVRHAFEAGRSTSVGQAAKSVGGVDKVTAVQWRQQDLRHFQAASMLSFGTCLNYATCWDAVRLGQPGRETLAAIGENLDTQAVTVLAPQVGKTCARNGGR